MNATRTVIMAMIVAIAMIGMTGFAMAGSTTQTYVGDGTYTTSWNGNGGTMNIDTYTSNGRDHLEVDFRHGYSQGTQTGSTNGWSVVDRSVSTNGRGTSILAATLDNSDNLVVIETEARRGGTYLAQTVYTSDDVFGYDVDGVISQHMMVAYGWSPSISVYTEAGDAWTVVDINNRYGVTYIDGIAVAGSGYGYAATGQMFNAVAYGRGHAEIVTSGDYVGSNVYIQNGGYGYSSYANGETYIELDDIYYIYRANGYVYAVDLP